MHRTRPLNYGFHSYQIKIYKISHKIIDDQNEWNEHVQRMNRDKLPRKLLEYKPERYRNRKRSLPPSINQ